MSSAKWRPFFSRPQWREDRVPVDGHLLAHDLEQHFSEFDKTIRCQLAILSNGHQMAHAIPFVSLSFVMNVQNTLI